MQLGVVFPQTEIGNDPSLIRDYAQAAEGAGYEHLLAFDHVLGAERDRPGGFQGPYDHETSFHEPFTLFGYLAGVTERLELVTGIIILPQRQTALVAKQTAQLHVLSGGRLRLGVGVGWNAVEFEGLGENFHNRGQRIEEQIALLRALWRDPVVSFEGRWHHVTKAGINPRPPGGTIPIWMGGMSDRVIERTGRLADGWFPQVREPADLRTAIERVHAAASAAGRDPSEVGIEARVSLTDPAAAGEAVERARAFEQAGATHVSVNTMGAQLSPRQHIEAIRAFAEASR
ncbi:MAG: LLM class F420-dependent oxidoreductase [Dehalococcoidia bacterium]